MRKIILGLLAIVMLASVIQTVHPFYGQSESYVTATKSGSAQTFTLAASFPVVNDTIKVFEVRTPEVTPEYVEGIGRKLEFTGSAGDSNPGTIGMVDEIERRHLQVYMDSGGIWYCVLDKMHPVVDLQPDLPSDDDAERIATEFLHNRDILPEGAVFDRVIADQQTTAVKGSDEVVSSYNVTLQAIFARKINNLPVVGPGNKLKVFIGDNSEVVGLFRVWRDIEPYKDVALKTPEAAYDDLVADNVVVATRAAGDEVTIKEVYLAYWMEPADSRQEYVLPVYVFEGDATNKEIDGIVPFTGYVRAVQDGEIF